jgi:hypothetical protein
MIAMHTALLSQPSELRITHDANITFKLFYMPPQLSNLACFIPASELDMPTVLQ